MTSKSSGIGIASQVMPGRTPKNAAAMITTTSPMSRSTTDAATASVKWEEAAQDTLARWAAFQKEDLASANALLERAKLKPLVLAPTNP